jgi:hypothetical protein
MSSLETEDGGVETRTRITENSLNEKVMALLRARASCADARSIMLEFVDDPALPYNWRIVHFDPGLGDRYACKVTLRSIHESLRSNYEMTGNS